MTNKTEEIIESFFKILNRVDVSLKVEKKKTGKVELSYLSWAWAWAELNKIYPNVTYKIERFGEDKKPYLYDEKLGYMVFTSMEIEGQQREMWLPVMDGANKAMRGESYTYEVKGWDGKPPTTKTVLAATMFDINTAIMRCLVKNISMFGLGLYIYAGEDLPESDEKPSASANKAQYEKYFGCLKKVTSKDMWLEVKPMKDKWVIWVNENYAEEWGTQLNDKFLELAKKYEPAPKDLLDDNLPM